MSKLEGQAKLIRRLHAIQKGRPLLREVQKRTIAEAKARVARKTGHTGRSILPGDLTDDHTIVTVGGAGVYLEFGTKPHRIPKAGNAKRPMPIGMSKRLSGRSRTGSGRKYVGKAGMPSHAWHVNHPGTKAQPFLLPGAKAALESLGITPIIEAWNAAA